MTAFAPADIPDNIDTLEQLAVWLGHCFLHLHAESRIQEAGRSYDIVAQGGLYQGDITGDPDNTPWYYVIRTNVPMLRDCHAYADLWEAAQELSTSALPARLKA